MSASYTRYRFSDFIIKQLLPLNKLDNWHGLIAVCYDYFIIAFAILIFHFQPWCYLISVILIGSRQRALGALSHESVHQRVAKSRKLNYFIGTFLTGYLLIQEHYTYQNTHIKKHHVYLGDAEKDPDYRYHIDEKLYEFHERTSFLKRFILKPFLLLKTVSYLWPLIRYRMMPRKKHLKYFLIMYTYLAIILAVFYQFHLMKYLMLLWIVPLLTSAAIIGWFNEIAEHYPLVGKHNVDLYMTRNRFSHWLEDFIFNTHDENYHLVHHLIPSIPFWNLKNAHKILCLDIEYLNVNKDMGGIFISADQRPSLIGRLLSSPAINAKGEVEY